MLQFINDFNQGIFILLTVIYLYQFYYLWVSLSSRRRKNLLPAPAAKNHKYAAIIAARNEGTVIGELIRSLKDQNYPQHLLDIFVIADNCTDDTAQKAREAGAIVYQRQNQSLVGKGYALDELFRKIRAYHRQAGYEAFFIFDADNLVDRNFVREMNRLYDHGYLAATCYRNSKNYDTNWITAGYSLWFLREARFLNAPRMMLGNSCAVSGTGFMVASSLLSQGWKWHLLTEDIQFSVECALKGVTIGYCETAVIYDEQPTTFRQSWQQRLRWSKGFYQVTRHYGLSLLEAATEGSKKSFSCYDMLMTIAPATLVTVLGITINLLLLISALVEPSFITARLIRATGRAILFAVINIYLALMLFGTATLITEWKRIRASVVRKVCFLFTFPIFIFTYIPISLVALVRKVQWTPIHHTVLKNINEIRDF